MAFTGYKNPFLKFQHLQAFTFPRVDSPPLLGPNRAAMTFTCGRQRVTSLFMFSEKLAGDVNSHVLSKKKKRPLTSHSSVLLPFVLPLLRSLPALRAHFFTLSLVIVQHPLCAWTLFIHELVNTSVNEGKRRFYRLSLCVEEAVWTARAPFLERMSRPLSALRVLWPFTSLFSPIHHCTALLSVSSATFSPPHIYHWLC